MLFFMLAAFSTIFVVDPGPGRGGPRPRAFFGVMMAFMTVIYSIFTVPSLVAAYALRKRNHGSAQQA
jgi:hypothetical protein